MGCRTDEENLRGHIGRGRVGEGKGGRAQEKLTLGLWGPSGRGRWEVLCLKSI